MAQVRDTGAGSSETGEGPAPGCPTCASGCNWPSAVTRNCAWPARQAERRRAEVEFPAGGLCDEAAPTALIADDEPLLRDELASHLLAQAWPELQVVARPATAARRSSCSRPCKPDICFLDVHMPGLSGIEAAQR
jgi:hypothetical protein